MGLVHDGKRIVARTEKGRIRSWDAIKGKRSPPTPTHRRPMANGRPVSPDDKLRIWAAGTKVHTARSD